MKHLLFSLLTAVFAMISISASQAAAITTQAPIAPSTSAIESPADFSADWDAMIDMAETGRQKRFIRRMERMEARQNERKGTTGQRSYVVALLLAIFLGYLGIDRFYLGYPGWGLIKLFTAGLGGVMWVIDIILIAFGILKPKRGGYKV